MNQLSNNHFRVFYSPDDGTGTSTPASTEDTFELLNVDDDVEKEEPPLEISDVEEEEEEEKEEVELDDEEETPKEPTEEELDELVTPVRRKEILAKYPTLFKDFPYLEKAYYREQQFTLIMRDEGFESGANSRPAESV